MQRLMSVVLCALFASACASEAPEQLPADSPEPMLELRVYFEGLVAFAPREGNTEAPEWQAIFATAPELQNGRRDEFRVPHSPQVFFSRNTVMESAQDGVPAVEIQGRMLSFEFDVMARTARGKLETSGNRMDYENYGEVPRNQKEAESFFWTPNMSAVTGFSDQGKLKEGWETQSMKGYVGGGVLLNDGKLATAALATAKCKDPEGSLAIVEFIGGTRKRQALAETLVLVIKKPISSLSSSVVQLRARDLRGSDADETWKIRDRNQTTDGGATISILIRNFPIPVHQTAVCTDGGVRTDGRHFDAFRTLARSLGNSRTYPQKPDPLPGSQPSIYRDFLGTKWHGVTIERPTYPPICPPAVFE